MAKYTVHHICGHARLHDLFGKGAERERKLAWLATVDCPDCYRAAKEAEKTAKNEAAAKENKEAGLPELTGTPKQVAWAETIRGEKIKSVKAVLAKLDKSNALYAIVDGLVSEVINNPSAKYWIDNRDVKFDGAFVKKLFDDSRQA